MRKLTSSSLQVLVAAALVGSALTAFQPAARAVAPTRQGGSTPSVSGASAHGRSRPLATMPVTHQGGPGHPALTLPPPTSAPSAPTAPTTRKAPTGHAFTAPSQNFEGIGHSIAGYSGGGTPPDENIDVSPTQVVQVVNTSIAVFSKTGALLHGPVDTQTLFASLTGTACGTRNDGDGVVRYDAQAHRWFVAQFAIPTAYGLAGPNYECVAVSATDDAMGAYHVYAFQDAYGGFPDYGKFGVWPDGYYATYNEFNAAGTSYLGAVTCAYDRTKMVAGDPSATQVCFNLGSSFFGLLPSDLEGPTPPPAGTPNYLLSLGSYYSGSSLFAWLFHVDWATPANSQITRSPNLTVASYNGACNTNNFTCVPEPSGGQTLDSLGDRLMFPLVYRNFGGDGMLTVSHAVNSGTTTGERWYQIAVAPGDRLSVAQQGTFAPADGQFRFMGSITSNRANDLALGYSTSSSTAYPDIRYTGRLAADAPGTMTQAEQTVFSGTGYETTYSRWGDYTSMVIDPTDDCTFWYTNEYYTPGVSYWEWNTRIASFTNPTCSNGDFGLSLSASSGSTSAGQATTTVHTAVATGAPGTIGLSVSGLPTGATAGFDQTNVSPGGQATLTIHAGTAAAGTYPLVITGQSVSARHSVGYSLTITNDFGVTITPDNGVATAPGTLTATVGSTVISGAASTLELSVSGVPAGATANLAGTLVMGNSTPLTIDPGTATAGDYTLTVTAHDIRTNGLTHTATYLLGIRPDYTVSVSPTSGTVVATDPITATVSTTQIFGGAAPLSLSVSGLPSGATASFSPASVNAGDSSTLTITPGTAANGTYPLTITAHNPSGGGVDRTSSYALVISRVVTAPGVTVRPLSPATLAGTTQLSWTGTGATYAVRTMNASPTTGFTAWTTPAAWQHLTSTTLPVSGLALGRTYCYSVRATNLTGTSSAWSPPTCITRALDDRALATSSHWKRAKGSAYWNHTTTVSQTKGAALLLARTTVTRVGIVASTCPTCGKVSLFVGKHLVGTISLKGPKANQRLILLPSFAARSGTLRVKVTSARKRVAIDGVVAAR